VLQEELTLTLENVELVLDEMRPYLKLDGFVHLVMKFLCLFLIYAFSIVEAMWQ
jgi:hypothetical protein